MAKSTPTPVAGVHPIDTGTAELAPDTVAGGWLLTINGAHSSHIDPDDPTLLDFDYMRQMAAVIEERHPDEARLRVLHLGAAACTMPRYLAARYPDARQVAVELDAELARLVREWFDLPRAPLLRIRVGDARAVLESLHPDSRDIVIRDAFADSVTPEHLTTREFVGAVADVLTPGGLYIANCGDSRDLRRARAEVATIGEVFTHVGIIADSSMLKGRRTGNLVIIGTDGPLDNTAPLVRRLLSDPLPASILVGDAARAFGSRPISDPASSDRVAPISDS